MQSAENERPITVLLCEDEILIMMTTSDLLADAGMIVVEAITAKDAREKFESEEVDVMVIDVGLPDASGLDLAKEIRLTNPDIPIVFATGNFRMAGTETMEKIAIVGKPYTERELITAISNLVS